MTGDVTKLPQWAQRHISRLEADLAHERARLDEAGAGSRVLADPYGDPPRRLGDHTMIRFHPHAADPRAYVDVRIDENHDGGRLLVRTSSELRVQPSSGNSIMLDARDPRFLPAGAYWRGA